MEDALNVVACCSGPSKQRVANGCMMVHAVLTAVLEWANYQPVIAASVDCLRLMLHYLNTGKQYVLQHLNSALQCLALPCLNCVALHILLLLTKLQCYSKKSLSFQPPRNAEMLVPLLSLDTSVQHSTGWFSAPA